MTTISMLERQLSRALDTIKEMKNDKPSYNSGRGVRNGAVSREIDDAICGAGRNWKGKFESENARNTTNPWTNYASNGVGQGLKTEAMTDDRAKAVVARHIDSFSGKDGLISIQDLRNIVDGVFTDDNANTDYPDELRQAAAHIVKNPAIFGAMDTADGRNTGGWGKHADGLVSKSDMAAALTETKMSRGDVQALDVLARNANKLTLKSNGCFDLSELGRLAGDPSQSTELRNACKYIAERKDMFMRMDTYAGLNRGHGGAGGGDGEVSMDDFRKLLANSPEFKAFNKERAERPEYHTALPAPHPRSDGVPYTGYARRFDSGRDFDHGRRFDGGRDFDHGRRLDSGSRFDRRPSFEGGRNFDSGRGAGMATASQALDALAQHFNFINGGQAITVGDLRRIADGQLTGSAQNTNYPPELRAAAKFLVDHPRLLGKIDTAGRLSGFQAGTDLLATSDWRAGVYVGQLEGDADVSGLASGAAAQAVGSNDLRSRYLGVYATHRSDSGFYVDGVLQAGRHRYTVQPTNLQNISGKGDSLLGSIEAGQSFAMGSGWFIEPQLQLVYQRLKLDDASIAGAVVRQEPANGWMARAGVRVKGEMLTPLGTLQPYGRLNVYHSASGTDLARFFGPSASTDITTSKGATSAELAGGFTVAVGPSTSVYGELGKLWAVGGDARAKSSVQGSVGVRVRW